MSAAPPPTPKKPVAFGATPTQGPPDDDLSGVADTPEELPTAGHETGPAVAMIHILTTISSMLAMLEGMASVMPGGGVRASGLHFSTAVQSLTRARQALG
jgi:hypothetical protein